jgi:FixJ family two-component response regulator
LNQKNIELAKALKDLNSNIEILTKVVALTMRKESLFKGKETKEEQVEALEDLGLSNKIIALIIGSTSDSVKSLRSKHKAKLEKTSQPELGKKENENIE